ncbi:MAG: phosphonate metabolism protein/1,5-bisphosphokinase (PRPP-forming) PhnN [Pseudomonadota bacterium]
MTRMARYALYFAPISNTPWWDAGCRWFGRNALDGAEFPQTQIPGISRIQLAKLTARPRRYGFHATLKPPFELADGFSESHLVDMAAAFCHTQRPIVLEDMRVRPIGDFLALSPAGQNEEIKALAMRCVSFFDLLRAPPTAGELQKRRETGLTARQEALLQRWGYPYVDEEYQLHMTLTDSIGALDEGSRNTIHEAAERRFAAAANTPLAIDGLTIFREEQPGSPLLIWRHFPFNPVQPASAMPAPGRLFYVVGPSGVGKDSLLQWVRQRVPADAGVVFAQRTITRASHASETYEATDVDTFGKYAAAGRFSMVWKANDLYYGVRRGIEANLKSGRDVIINGSREYVPQLVQSFPDAQVVWIEADTATIQERLVSRQRESGAALLRRIDRALEFAAPTGQKVVRLDNSGPLDVAGQRLLELLKL